MHNLNGRRTDKQRKGEERAEGKTEAKPEWSTEKTITGLTGLLSAISDFISAKKKKKFCLSGPVGTATMQRAFSSIPWEQLGCP